MPCWTAEQTEADEKAANEFGEKGEREMKNAAREKDIEGWRAR